MIALMNQILNAVVRVLNAILLVIRYEAGAFFFFAYSFNSWIGR